MGIALITQMGEQADYLRFMPEKTATNGPPLVGRGAGGRARLGAARGGPQDARRALLAYLAISNAVPIRWAVDPNQMYLAAYEYVFRICAGGGGHGAVRGVSQLKINVTNAYAGSLAWSNFFARLTHSHPGRVVWVVFNTAIALMLMELDVFQAPRQGAGPVFQHAIAWMMAVVADLVINKPLGLSPPGIEFKRAHLYDVNPVGVGRDGVASLLSVGIWGRLGPMAPGVLGAHRAGHRLRGFAAHRLGHRRALLPRARQPPRGGAVEATARAARSASANTRPTTWPSVRPIQGPRSAPCAARWTPAATICASRMRQPPSSGRAMRRCCRARVAHLDRPGSATTCC